MGRGPFFYPPTLTTLTLKWRSTPSNEDCTIRSTHSPPSFGVFSMSPRGLGTFLLLGDAFLRGGKYVRTLWKRVAYPVETGHAPCGNGSCTLWKWVVYPVETGRAPCGNGSCTLWKWVVHPVETGSAPCRKGIPGCGNGVEKKKEQATLYPAADIPGEKSKLMGREGLTFTGFFSKLFP